ncbi:hypothetical protein N7466_003523 [Penicillium verhagenii]|uniref:uncharacterized protein n=1 Tax=Penicillium verhagenii TaxID=1562060 RepID=UPI0025456388|nr:uncharacterized protein N7466_003523 [Penicillium verhagenii]KAJ5937073.1 hypothetical protein N7466_003523 [Penicillium verhagenii]
MEAESRISINSLFKQCLEKLQKLLNSIPDERSDASLTVQDDLGRLRVWIGNFGAHRKPTDRLSLDHRLREAPDLHREVCNHINDISEAIQAAIPLLSQNLSKPPSNENLLGIGQISLESRPEDINSGSESSDSDSDEFWDQIRAENDIHSELDEYLQDIRFTISSLYKFSLTLQNPAHRDLTSRASRIDLSHFEFYDIQHVSDKFNLSTDSVLAQRLGRANTKRRQLLAYYKEHVGKISRHLDIVVAKAIEMPMDLPKDKEIFKAPQSISTKWTQDTTVSTIIPLEIDSRSDSARTKFSVTSSATGDQQIPLMPPPPHQHPESDAGKIPFFCPYCHQTIQLENMDQDWDYHVYSDLRPYICTFAGCIKPDQIYDSYTEWSEHERQQHRREWFCNLCSTNYQSGQSILLHFGEAHGEAVPEEQRQALVQLSERAVSSPQQCPLCTKSPISNPRRYQEHLARHLQQLSLFALPRLDSKEADGISRDGASDESNRPLAFDDEDHQSLRSTPSQDSLPVERTPSPRLDSTFVLPIGGIGAKNDDMTEEPLGKEDRLVDLNDTKNLGSNKEDSVLNLQGLAKLYWRQANLEKTESLLIQVLRIRQETLGADHKDTLSSTEDLALLEHVRSRLQYAESRLMPVTETRQPNFGLDNACNP